jgi:hypothetical protein
MSLMLMRDEAKKIDSSLFDNLTVDAVNRLFHLLRKWDILYHQKTRKARQNTRQCTTAINNFIGYVQ